jgi:hypothetical protein
VETQTYHPHHHGEMESGISDTDLKWECLSNSKEDRELLTGRFQVQGAAKGTNDTLEIFYVFFSNRFWKI